MERREFLLGASGAAWNLALAAKRKALAATDDKNTDMDAYARYVRTSQDFRRVRQDRAWINKAYPGWIYMPWTYQWNIGYTGASGPWSRAHGYNGAFLDGNGFAPDTPPGKLAWINRHALRFYVDHTAGKGSLHLWDGDKKQAHLAELHGTGYTARSPQRGPEAKTVRQHPPEHNAGEILAVSRRVCAGR